MTIFLLTRISLKEGRIPIFHTQHFSHQRPLELFQSEGGCRVLAWFNVGSWEVQSLRSIMEFIPCREVPSLKLTGLLPLKIDPTCPKMICHLPSINFQVQLLVSGKDHISHRNGKGKSSTQNCLQQGICLFPGYSKPHNS